MTSYTAEALYHLLPALYRLRDARQGEVLKALVTVLAEQAGVVENDIAGLYENAFIETCDEWVVPYIGDLLGVRHLYAVGHGSRQRGYVANTLALRRRKGTVPVLEQLARDVTGWTARVVEFFQLLDTTQHVNHVRLHNLRTPNLRHTNQLELLGGAFENAAHTAEVRSVTTSRGKYNIANIALFLWRLQSYAFTRVSARAMGSPADGRYTFHPAGLDAPLFNRPQTETEITHLAQEINVPGALRRRPLYDELEARRQTLVDGLTPRPVYFGDPAVLQVFIDGHSAAIPAEEVVICDLSDLPAGDWRRPATSKTYVRLDTTVEPPLPVQVNRPIQVAVDPVLGRLAFPTGIVPARVEVSYAYGFSADIGGGPYDRRDSVASMLTRPVTWQLGVSRELPPLPGEVVATLSEAVQAWNAQPAGSVGIIAILDSHTYSEALTGATAITIPEASQLLLVAADWPQMEAPETPGVLQRPVGQVVPHGRRPHILGDLEVLGTAAATSQSPGALGLHGLLIEGALSVLPGALGSVHVAHTTLLPGAGGVLVHPGSPPAPQQAQLHLRLERSICGPLTLFEAIAQLHIVDSIIDSPAMPAIVAPETLCEINTSTIFGQSRAGSLEASASLFTDTLYVERRQSGCVRFSYVPEGSQTPRRYRCQPDVSLEQRATALGLAAASALPASERARILARLRPQFTSTRYGDPGYAQLSRLSPEGLRHGAEDGAEMGAFSHLKQPQREANLRTGLDEYLRFGLQAGYFFVT